jgi:uncharacterized damage-inducible protein DinB
MSNAANQTLTGERADIARSLAKHRGLLLHTARGLTDEQAATQSTVSALCVGGIIKHVAAVERQWCRFVTDGPSAMAEAWGDEYSVHAYLDGFRMLAGETLGGLIADFQAAAARTDALLAGLPDLDAEQPLPEAPWFEKGVTWSARQVMLHLIAEIAQHSGHADIIREAIDGQKSMG